MATTKKIVNSVSTCVDDSLSGFLCLHPGLCQLQTCPRVIVRADLEQYMASQRVTIVVGGGSGHEPAFTGYVGPGMMSCAVQGNVFASPGPSALLAGLRACGAKHSAGVLLLSNNYTGDRLNFGIAVERARAEGIKVEYVTIGEDCAVMQRDKTAGRRGLAGCVLVMKIAGALADKGEPLEGIVEKLHTAMKGLVTLGVCLSPCSLPGGSPLFSVGPDDMELGLGLHGEAGVTTTKMKTAKETVEMMLNYMTDTSNPAHLDLQKGTNVVVLINNLGATSDLEINIIVKDTIDYLGQRGVTVARIYAHRYITSQEMAGFSLTLMDLSSDFILTSLDTETKASHWVQPFIPDGFTNKVAPRQINMKAATEKKTVEKSSSAVLSNETAGIVRRAIHAACQALVDAEQQLNSLDSGAGDGDCGTTLADGARGILSALDQESSLPFTCPHDLLLALAGQIESSMGGCSGALYSLLLTAAAPKLLSDVSESGWVHALGAGIQAIMKYGGAEPGDRTMVDALNAAHEVLKKDSLGSEKFTQAAQAATKRAQDTSKMAARAGRASYVNPDHVTQPDPGAVAVGIWMTALIGQIN